MNRRPAVCVLVALAIFCAPSAWAKGKPGAAAKPAPAAPAAAAADAKPSKRLSPLVREMNELLPLSTGAETKRTENMQSHKSAGAQLERLRAAPGEIALLRARFAAQRTAAPAEEQPVYDAALAVCDTMTAALNERREAHANAQAAAAVHSIPDATTKKAHKEAKERDKMFESQEDLHWKKRKEELLGFVDQRFAQLQVLEAQKLH
jgi:hypothetical protein